MELIVSTLQEEWGRHYPRQCQLPLPIFHVFYILNLPPHRFSLSLSPPSSSFLPFLSSSLHSFFLVLFPSVFSSSCWFFHGLSISHFLLLWDGEGKVSLPSSYVSYWEGRVCFLFILLGSWSWWLRKPGWNTVPPLKGTARFLAGVLSDVLTGVPPTPPASQGCSPQSWTSTRFTRFIQDMFSDAIPSLSCTVDVAGDLTSLSLALFNVGLSDLKKKNLPVLFQIWFIFTLWSPVLLHEYYLFEDYKLTSFLVFIRLLCCFSFVWREHFSRLNLLC